MSRLSKTFTEASSGADIVSGVRNGGGATGNDLDKVVPDAAQAKEAAVQPWRPSFVFARLTGDPEYDCGAWAAPPLKHPKQRGWASPVRTITPSLSLLFLALSRSPSGHHHRESCAGISAGVCFILICLVAENVATTEHVDPCSACISSLRLVPRALLLT